jgi:hypothetical protein
MGILTLLISLCFFCTIVHRFAQRFAPNLIDAENKKLYLAPQIEPGSLRTLRLSLQGAAASPQLRRGIERKLRSRIGPSGWCDKPNGRYAASGYREG